MRYRLVIFDMDGTLTHELLDFDAIRRDIGLPPSRAILEAIECLPPAERSRAYEVLDRHEAAAARGATLHDGVHGLLSELKQKGVKTALLTRNSRRCAEHILSAHRLSFDHVATRDNPPYKPHPDSILNITRALGQRADRTLMVGDYLYDLQAAANAGTHSALACMKYGGGRPAFANQATYCVSTLAEILPIVERTS